MTPPLAPVVDPQVSDTSRSRSDSMCGLASLLLDWRVECERHLRALTSIQRWLEHVRCGAAAEGERELLIQEMGRLLQQPPRPRRVDQASGDLPEQPEPLIL